MPVPHFVGLGRRDWVWGALYEANGIILVPAILLLLLQAVTRQQVVELDGMWIVLPLQPKIQISGEHKRVDRRRTSTHGPICPCPQVQWRSWRSRKEMYKEANFIDLQLVEITSTVVPLYSFRSFSLMWVIKMVSLFGGSPCSVYAHHNHHHHHYTQNLCLTSRPFWTRFMLVNFFLFLSLV